MMMKATRTTRSCTFFLALYLLLLGFAPRGSDGAATIGADGLCPLFLFLPFTHNGTASVSFSSQREERMNPGLAMLAAALLAMEHFNDRNATVVPELASWRQGCSVRFDLNSSKAFDTGTIGHGASRQLFRELLSTTTAAPCAIAGPFGDAAALQLGAGAAAAEFPVVAHRAYNALVDSDRFSPYTSLVFPGLPESVAVAVRYLRHKHARTDFVSLLYPTSELNVQRREALALALDAAGMRWDAHSFSSSGEQRRDGGDDDEPPLPPQRPGDEFRKVRSPRAALRQVKERGYRTIVMFFEDPLREFPPLADAAQEMGMNNGDYLWLWFGAFDPAFLFSENPNVPKLLAGSPLLLPLDVAEAFYPAWRAQGAAFADRVNALNPIQEGAPGHARVDADYFRRHRPEWGSGFLYDAVVSIGIGACLAEKERAAGGNNNNNNSTVTGLDHLRGIRSVNFVGATGEVKFHQVGERKGGRVPSTARWAGFNLFPPQPPGADPVPYTLADMLAPGSSSSWTEIAPFVYADGRTVPPDLLRDPPDQNHLNRGLRAFGLALLASVWAAAIGTVAWVYLHREHRVLTAAQPAFLYVLATGAVVSASTILMISFDESSGWSPDALSTACVASTWLMSIGVLLTYGALFSKLWRVNRVLQFSRREVEIRQVVWPVVVLVVCAIAVLSIWTARDSLEWNRVETDEITGESIGRCEGDHSGAYVGALVGIMLIPIVLTGFMAYKTKDVDDKYSEAKWIWILFLVQFEVFLVAFPTVILLRDVSTDGRYLGLTFIYWIYPMSTLSLIMIPKISAYRKAISGRDGSHPHKRGESHGVNVSGLSGGSFSQAFAVDHRAIPISGRHNEHNTDGGTSDLEVSAESFRREPAVDHHDAIPISGVHDDTSHTSQASGEQKESEHVQAVDHHDAIPISGVHDDTSHTSQASGEQKESEHVQAVDHHDAIPISGLHDDTSHTSQASGEQKESEHVQSAE